MKFSDIPQFTKRGNYRVNVSWRYLEDHLNHWNERGELVLDPDFQRGHVWSEEKQVRYVEYILRGGVGSRDLFFNQKGWMMTYDGPLVLVDGKQRLEAVRRFLRNELAIFNGHYLKDFSEPLRFAGGADFIFNVNDLKTRKEVLQWYIDLNEGGVVHTEEEINRVKSLLEMED